MNIDDQMVLKFLNGDQENEFKNHWIFHNIEKGEYLFESPDADKRESVHNILVHLKNRLQDFSPLNVTIFSALYPEWKTIMNDVNVLLAVGCPQPYDAMVIEYNGIQYMIFDLIRFNEYKELGYNIDMLIRQLLTHEASHICLHKKYPAPLSDSFADQLKYIAFDEGFAHLLAFKDDVESYDFAALIYDHYNSSLMKLQKSFKEEKLPKQRALLLQSNSGHYWDKFAAVSGKLFLASRIDQIQNLYNAGIDCFISSMKPL